jgi:uncharacterized protein YjbI with pentapeptide repeats
MSRFEKCFTYTVLCFAVPYGTYLCTFNTSLMEWLAENIVGILTGVLTLGLMLYIYYIQQRDNSIQEARNILLSPNSFGDEKKRALETLAKHKRSLAGVEVCGTPERLVNLSGLDLSKEKYGYGVDLEGSHFKGTILTSAKFNGARLQFVNFRGAGLWLTCFKNAGLWGANFEDAYLPNAHFENAYLCSANFSNAIVSCTTFSGANLLCVTFHNADLCSATFHGADLKGTNFKGTNFKGTNLAHTQFCDPTNPNNQKEWASDVDCYDESNEYFRGNEGLQRKFKNAGFRSEQKKKWRKISPSSHHSLW